MGRLGVGREGDVVELAQAQPFPVHGHTEVAEINGLPGSLRDLVRGGGWGIGLRRQVGHDDDSADITTTTTTPLLPLTPGKGPSLTQTKPGTDPGKDFKKRKKERKKGKQ